MLAVRKGSQFYFYLPCRLVSGNVPQNSPRNYLIKTGHTKAAPDTQQGPYLKKWLTNIFTNKSTYTGIVPPQKYRLGTISNIQLLAGLNRFYMAISSP